jgi:sensor histidine kinase YesM/ligand-binding sensor domain-containing protein
MFKLPIDFKRFILPFIFLSLSQFNLVALNYNFQVFDAKNGLSAPEVTHVISDSKSFVWIAGADGLTRYDGKKFINFNRSLGLNDTQVHCIIEGENNTIICGTRKGISFFNGYRYTNISMFENKFSKPAHHFVKAIYRTKKNEIYAGCTKGLFKYDKKRKQFIRIPEIKDFVLNFFETKTGEILVTTVDEFYSIQNGKVKKLTYKAEAKITSIIQISSDVYWAGTTNGLAKLKRKNNTFECIQKYGNQPIVNCIQLKNKQLLFASKFGLLHTIDKSNIQTIDLSFQIMPLDITAIAEDFQGNCWITSSLGLIKMTHSEFTTPSYVKDIAAPIASLVSDRKGTLFFGTTNGLKELKNGKLSTYLISSNPPDNFVSALSFIDNSIYLGTFSGDVYQFENGKFILIFRSSIRDCCIYKILKPTKNQFWISTGENVIHLLNDVPKIYKFSTQYTQSILLDHSKQLWCANLTKLKIIKNGQLQNAPKQFNAYDNFVTVTEDDNKTIWVGTYGNGLLRYSNGKVTAITIEQGLSNNYVTSTFFDSKQHCIWVGTSYGLSKVSLTHSGKISAIKNYLNEPERENYGCVQNAICQLPSGNILVSVGEEIIEFNDFGNEFRGIVKSHKLPVYFASIRVNKKEYTSKMGNFSQHQSLKASEKNVEFTFNALDFHSPQTLKYSWKLKGYDNKWTTFSERNYASYTNLPHGSYSFLVKVKNQTGEFSSAVPVTFTIAKPFYFEWWFLLLAIAIPILLIGLILKRSISKIKKREAEKTANFNKLAEAELKTLRAQMNPHFMFNTLNAVQELVLNGNDELSRIYFADFAKMMRMILHNSTEKFISLEKEIEFLELYLKFEKIRFQDKFKVIFTLDPALETFNIRIPGMIIQPIIENAINHGLLHRKEGGILEIILQEIQENGNNKLVCCVKDNGIGLKNTSTLNSNKEEGHRSISSLITKERIELLNMIYGAGKYALTINEIEDSGSYKGTKVELKIEIEA